MVEMFKKKFSMTVQGMSNCEACHLIPVQKPGGFDRRKLNTEDRRCPSFVSGDYRGPGSQVAVEVTALSGGFLLGRGCGWHNISHPFPGASQRGLRSPPPRKASLVGTHLPAST